MEKENQDALPNQPVQPAGSSDVIQEVQESKTEPKIETAKEDETPLKTESKIETDKADGPPAIIEPKANGPTAASVEPKAIVPPAANIEQKSRGPQAANIEQKANGSPATNIEQKANRPPAANIEPKIKTAKEDGPPAKVVNPLRLARPLQAAKRSTHPMPLPTISPFCPPGSAGKASPMAPTPPQLCTEANNSTPTTSKFTSQPSKLPPPSETKVQLISSVAAPPPIMQPLKANIPPTEACNIETVRDKKSKDIETPIPVIAQDFPIKDAPTPTKKEQIKDKALEPPRAVVTQVSPIKDAPTSSKKEQINGEVLETKVADIEQGSPIKKEPPSKKEQIKDKPQVNKVADIAKSSPIKDELTKEKKDNTLNKPPEATAIPEQNKRKRKREINPPPPVPDMENRTSKRSRSKVSSYQDDFELEQAMRAIQKQDLEEKRSKASVSEETKVQKQDLEEKRSKASGSEETKVQKQDLEEKQSKASGSEETKVLENNIKTLKNNQTTSKNTEDMDVPPSSVVKPEREKRKRVEEEKKCYDEDDDEDVPIAKRRQDKKKREKSREINKKEVAQKIKPTREKKKKKMVPKKIIHRDNSKEPVFFKKEYLAVRNIEGGFFLCTAVQNIYPGDHNIQIMWLSNEFPVTQTKDEGIYCADFKDLIDFETILSSVEMEPEKVKGNKKIRHTLDTAERERIGHILQRAIDKAEGKLDESTLQLTEDNPDGLDISLYTGEDQLDKIEERRNKGEKSKDTPKIIETSKAPKKNKKPSKIAKATSDLKLKITTVNKKGTPDLNPTEDTPPKKDTKTDEFDFNEDSEEEVVPVPKKRSLLNKQ